MPNHITNILVADDDETICDLLEIFLTSEGYNVIKAHDGVEVLEHISLNINLYILDVVMPNMTGLEACREIRKISTSPILFLTAKGEEQDKVEGFTAGADDYLLKPFSPTELLARVKALLRRQLVYDNVSIISENEDQISLRDLLVNKKQTVVFVGGIEKKLTPTEFNILVLLCENRGEIFSAEEIYEKIWKEDYYHSAQNTVMVHIRKLREKIESNPQKPEYVKTVWGRGYKID